MEYYDDINRKLTFKEIVELVEENNSMYDANWSDWTSEFAIFENYEIELASDEDYIKDWVEEALARAIKTNGESLIKDLEEYHTKIWG